MCWACLLLSREAGKYLSLSNFNMVWFLLEYRGGGLDDLLVDLSAPIWEQYATQEITTLRVLKSGQVKLSWES